MSTIGGVGGETIHIEFPKTKFVQYLKTVGKKESKDLIFDELRRLFLLIIVDFLSGKLSLDEMSEMASALWKPMTKKDNDHEGELNKVLLSASELNFYVRRIPEIKPEGKTFVWFMTDIMTYFEKNKSHLNRID